MTPEQWQIFKQAQMLKDLGHFPDLTVQQVFEMLLEKQEKEQKLPIA
jgi:hypothetical protein